MTKARKVRYKDRSESYKREHRKKVNAWRKANKAAIKAAAEAGITLAAYRKKHDIKVKPSSPVRRKKATRSPRANARPAILAVAQQAGAS